MLYLLKIRLWWWPLNKITHPRRKFVVSSISGFLSLLQCHPMHSVLPWTWISCSSPNKPHAFLLFVLLNLFLFIWISLSCVYKIPFISGCPPVKSPFQWCFPDTFNWILSLFGTLLFFASFLWQIHFVLIRLRVSSQKAEAISYFSGQTCPEYSLATLPALTSFRSSCRLNSSNLTQYEKLTI